MYIRRGVRRDRPRAAHRAGRVRRHNGQGRDRSNGSLPPLWPSGCHSTSCRPPLPPHFTFDGRGSGAAGWGGWRRAEWRQVRQCPPRLATSQVPSHLVRTAETRRRPAGVRPPSASASGTAAARSGSCHSPTERRCSPGCAYKQRSTTTIRSTPRPDRHLDAKVHRTHGRTRANWMGQPCPSPS